MKEEQKEKNMTETEKRAEERLLKRRQIDSNGCWRYTGASTSNGYGWMTYRGRNEYAHRLAAIIFLDYDPRTRLWVCHTCDTPICFNPNHLFIGTPRENMEDAATKGRMTGKKLNPPQVARIKYLLGNGATQRSLAVEYGVSTTAIGQIARGQTWQDVAPAEGDGKL
jgi:HNH endonuclease